MGHYSSEMEDTSSPLVPGAGQVTIVDAEEALERLKTLGLNASMYTYLLVLADFVQQQKAVTEATAKAAVASAASRYGETKEDAAIVLLQDGWDLAAVVKVLGLKP